MKFIKYLLALTVLGILTGCAHPMMISPDSSKLVINDASQTSPKKVAYYIPEELINLEVRTPGGGGDNVTYKPYKDLESGIYKVLNNVFSNVTKLKTTHDVSDTIDYVIHPKLITHSSSDSLVTWPPTSFKIELTCTIQNPQGQILFTKTVVGEGSSQYNEFKQDFSLSGKRAAEDVLLKLQSELLTLPR